MMLKISDISQEAKNIRAFFPIFNNIPNLVYLDNGATTHKPQCLLEAMNFYYSNLNANVGRGSYPLAQASDDAYNLSKENIAKYFHVSSQNLVITSGATDSSNLAVNLALQNVNSGKVVTSFLEHHSNFLPLQELAKTKGLDFIVIEDLDELNNPEILPSNFWNDVKVLSLTHVSNTTGRIIPIDKWTKIAKSKNITTIVDGSQAVSSLDVDIKSLGVDFYYFSAHKMYGPMGLGALYISDKFLNFKPLKLGGGIVDYVTKSDYTLKESIDRFEAGTPNVASVYAFSKVLEFLTKYKKNIYGQHILAEYMFSEIKKIQSQNYYIMVLDENERNLYPDLYSSLVSFVVLNKNAGERGLHSHDIGSYLTENDICVRFGQHCAHPLHTEYHISSTVRASLGLYNTKEDIDYFLKILQDGLNKFDAI